MSLSSYITRRATPAILALFLFGPGLAAQGPRFLRDSMFPSDPIQLLLDGTAELRLTGEQSAQLRKIQTDLHASNDPLVAQLVTIRRELRASGRLPHRDMSAEQRSAFQAAVQRARPLMQTIARNNQAAMERVGAVLTPAQKDQVRTWIRHTPGVPGTMPHGPGGGPGNGRGGRGPAFLRGS